MKGDFSRFTFVKAKHYSGVRMQQGRVQLDADWNEQLDIATHLRETSIGDIVGGHGAPDVGGGFDVQVVANKITLTAGRYYVDGILLENDADVAVDAQPDLPGFTQPTTPGWYVVYLDVFRRHLTGLEDPDVLEPALGGPDTATRQKTVWQVRLQAVDPANTDPGCTDFVVPRSGTVARLSARSASQPSENQLYRVEVHQGSFDLAGAPQTPTFKWSRDNGSVAARIDDPAMNEIRVSAQISQDLAGGFAAGQWIEVTDDERLLTGEPGVFAQLATVEGQILTVSSWPGGAAPTLGPDAILRRWESDELTIDQPPTNDGFLALEDGVEIRFENPSAEFHTGDYWAVAGRAAAGVLWPVDTVGDPVPQDPHGVYHHFAPLALVQLVGTTWNPPPADMAKRCRKSFRPVTIDPGEPKVKISGDMMTGKLTIDADLMVLGVATIGEQTSAGVPGKLVMDQAPIEPATGDLATRGIHFPKVSTEPTDEAFLRRFASGTQRKLVLGVGNADDEVLSLRQRGQDLVTLTGTGNVGIGTSDPQAGLHVDVDKILLEGPLFIPGNTPEKDQVLTAIDSEGQAEWRDLPERQIGVPAFLSNKIQVASASGKTDGWVTFSIDPAKVPPDANAIILEAEGAQNRPDSGDVDTHLLIRKGPDEAQLLLLRGRAAGSGDNAAWAGQGIFPVTNGAQASFQYQVTAPGFVNGYAIHIVGFYP